MNTRYLVWVGLGAALAFAFAILALAPPASAINDPPGTGGTVYGDWTVQDSRSYSAVTITVQDGNLYIQSGGTLTLNNVRLVFYQTLYPGYNYSLEVQAGGTLNTDNRCVITSASTSTHYNFVIKGSASLNRTTISEMWGDIGSWKGGIQIYSDSVSITNCTVSYGMTGGISIFDCSPTIYQNAITANGQDGQCATYCYGLYAWNTKSTISSNQVYANNYKQSTYLSYSYSGSPGGYYYYGSQWISIYGYTGNYEWYYNIGYCYRYLYTYDYQRANFYGTGVVIQGGSKATFSNNTVQQNGYSTPGYGYTYSNTYDGSGYAYSPYYYQYYGYYWSSFYTYQYKYQYYSWRDYGMGLIVNDSSVSIVGNTFDSNGFASKHDYWADDNSACWYNGVNIAMNNSDGDITDNTINNAVILVDLVNCRTNFTGNKMLGDFIGGAVSYYSANFVPSNAVYGIRANRSVIPNILNNTLTIQYKDYPYYYVDGQSRGFARFATAVELGTVDYKIAIQGNRIVVDSQYYGSLGVKCINLDLRTNLQFLDNYVEYKRSNMYGSGYPDCNLLPVGNRNDVLISNCTFKGPIQAGGGNIPSPTPIKTGGAIVYGITSFYGTKLTIVNCSFTGCDFTVQTLYAVDLKLSSSTFSNTGIAIQSFYAGKVKLTDVSLSTGVAGLQASYASQAELFNVSFKQCDAGVQVTDFSKASLKQVNILGSKILSLAVEGRSSATLQNCQLTGAIRGLQAISSDVVVKDCTMSHFSEFLLDLGALVNVFNTPHTKGAATMMDNASYLNVSWQVRFNVIWQNDVPVEGASVLIATLFGDRIFSGTTDALGSPADVLWVKEYMGHNQVVTKYNPHRITCAKGRASSTDFFVIDQQLNITFRLVDAIPPDLVVSFPFDRQLLNFSLVTFKGTASDPEAGLLDGVVQINIDNTGWTTLAVSDLDSSWSFTRPLGDGIHIIRIKAVDLVGNMARASLTVSVDTLGPVLQVFTPTEGCFTNQRTITVTGITEENAIVTVNSISAQLQKRYFTSQISLEDGPNTITVTSSDASGNTRIVLVHVTLDTNPPVLDISIPKQGSYTNQNPISVLGTTEPSAVVKVNGITAHLVNNTFESLVDLSEGANTITVSATDLAGNVKRVTLLIYLDTFAPDLSLFTPRDRLWTNSSKVLVTGATEQGATVTINGQNTNVVSSVFSGYVNLLEGSNRIEVVAKDLAGNLFSIARTVYLDTRLPDLVVTAPADKLAVSSRVIPVVGSVDWGTEVLINGEPVAVADFVFSTTLAFSEDGTQVVEVVARDLAGNTAIVARTIKVDTTSPVITLSYPVEGMKVKQRMITVSGQTEPFSTVVVNTETLLVVGRDGLFSVPVQLEDGSNRITVAATDAAGNLGTETVTITKPVDKVAPKADLSWALNLTGLLLGIGIALPIMTYVLTDSWRRRRSRVLVEIEAAEQERMQREAESARRAALPTVERVGRKRARAPVAPKEEPRPEPPVMAEPPKPEATAPEAAKLGLKDKSGATEAGAEETDQATKMEAKSTPAEEPRAGKPEEPESDLKDKGSEAEHGAGETELPAEMKGK